MSKGVKLSGKALVADDAYIKSQQVTIALQSAALLLWGINAVRDYGKSPIKDAVIIGTGIYTIYGFYQTLKG